MRVTVVRPGDLGPEEARLWAKFQQASPVSANPFLSLSFAQAVGRFRPGARVAVVDDGGQIEAFLPFELTAHKMGMPIGHPMNELHGFIGSGAPIDAKSVVRKSGLRGWRFLHVPAEQASLLPYRYQGTDSVFSVIDLTGGFQSYLSSRHKQTTRRIAEKRRSLARQLGDIRLVWNSPRLEDLHQVIEWKAANYSSARLLFSTEPGVIRMLEELVAADHADCRGVVSILYAGEQPVAAHLGLLGPHGLAWWYPAYDAALGRFSPGAMMLFALAEESANQGVHRIDLGPGPFKYKAGMATESYAVIGGAVWASAAEAALRRLYRSLYYDRSRRDTEAA